MQMVFSSSLLVSMIVLNLVPVSPLKMVEFALIQVPLLLSPRVPWNTGEFEIATAMLPATGNQMPSVIQFI